VWVVGSEYAARYNNVDFTHKLFWTVYGSAVKRGGGGGSSSALFDKPSLVFARLLPLYMSGLFFILF
jgi:hypothetical protein